MKPDRTVYTGNDLQAFREARSLVIAPKFQRRGVWKRPARAYFIDTLLRGLPVPPIYVRVTQSEDKKRTIREIVDGQQRITALLDYIDGKYALTRFLDPAYAGKQFDELTEEEQDRIRSYPLYCEVFQGISDTEVLEIFARLNTYSIQLNAQELRNGTYFGYFKQSSYSLALEHIEFWRRNRIVTEDGIARMREVELTSELLIAEIDGLQDKKTSINHFYAEFDEGFPEQARYEREFRSTIDMISEALEDTLRQTDFRRPPLFYSLFCTVYHRQHGLPNAPFDTPRRPLTTGERRSLRSAVIDLSDIVTAARAEESIPSQYSRFVVACLQQTDNIQPRAIRLQYLYEAAF